jgi:hypothetical protein
MRISGPDPSIPSMFACLFYACQELQHEFTAYDAATAQYPKYSIGLQMMFSHSWDEFTS